LVCSPAGETIDRAGHLFGCPFHRNKNIPRSLMRQGERQSAGRGRGRNFASLSFASCTSLRRNAP
jgi:hypothetical protein